MNYVNPIEKLIIVSRVWILQNENITTVVSTNSSADIDGAGANHNYLNLSLVNFRVNTVMLMSIFFTCY